VTRRSTLARFWCCVEVDVGWQTVEKKSSEDLLKRVKKVRRQIAVEKELRPVLVAPSFISPVVSEQPDFSPLGILNCEMLRRRFSSPLRSKIQSHLNAGTFPRGLSTI
jgi:hypothetical protein